MKKPFLKQIKHLLAAAALCSSSLAGAGLVALDEVVATVDNDVVMASELQQRVAMVNAQLKASNTPMPDLEVLRSQVLEQLILESLQLQMAERAGVTIGEDELDEAIGRMASANGMTMAQLKRRLASDGMAEATMRAQVRRDMLIDRVQRGSVNRRIQISEQEVKNFLKSKQGQLWSAPDVNIGHIIVPVPAMSGEAEVAQIESRVKDILARLRAGADFRQVAITESQGQNRLQGGDLGWRKISELPELFAQAVENLSPGEVSEPVRSGAGFHLLKLYDKRGPQQQVIQQSLVRHILIKPSDILTDDEARQKLAKIRQEIINGRSFAEAAREYSEDVGSMLSGGDLGWSLPGKFVPEFEQTIETTPVGKISQPFRSQFGWHILEVQKRRNEDMSDTVRTNQAMNLLRSQRFEEERFNWLREIRDEAFVQIKK